MLRDHIVCGINDDTIQRRLFAESGLMFKKSLKIAQSVETTACYLRKLHPAAAGSSKRETSIDSNKNNN